MRRAGRILESVHARILDKVEPGMRKCDLVAEIYDAALRGTPEFGGDYPAIVPLLPSGTEASACHLTWDDKPLKKGEGTFFEVAGVYKSLPRPDVEDGLSWRPDAGNILGLSTMRGIYGALLRDRRQSRPAKGCARHRSGARRAGAVILIDCAVRGLDTAGGRVTAAVTERGRIACQSVVVAGGAWSRRFSKDLGLRQPQLKVRASVMRTAPLEGAPTTALWSNAFGFRKRLDGGYTIGDGSANIVTITPDSFRFFGDFLPVLRTEFSSLRLRVDGRFLQEWREARPVRLDRPSPYEAVRVLDPEPDRKNLRKALRSLSQRFPIIRRGADGAGMGGAHRRDAGCGSGDLEDRQPVRPRRRDRLLRPWLRHRPCCRAPRRRSRHPGDAYRRSDRVPLLALLRRLEAAADGRDLTEGPSRGGPQSEGRGA
jgi:hypothetical protein